MPINRDRIASPSARNPLCSYSFVIHSFTFGTPDAVAKLRALAESGKEVLREEASRQVQRLSEA